MQFPQRSQRSSRRVMTRQRRGGNCCCSARSHWGGIIAWWRRRRVDAIWFTCHGLRRHAPHAPHREPRPAVGRRSRARGALIHIKAAAHPADGELPRQGWGPRCLQPAARTARGTRSAERGPAELRDATPGGATRAPRRRCAPRDAPAALRDRSARPCRRTGAARRPRVTHGSRRGRRTGQGRAPPRRS